MWRNPMPWKNCPETPNIGTWAQTDDIRPGLGWTGSSTWSGSSPQGGVLVAAENTAEFAIQFGFASGVPSNRRAGARWWEPCSAPGSWTRPARSPTA